MYPDSTPQAQRWRASGQLTIGNSYYPQHQVAMLDPTTVTFLHLCQEREGWKLCLRKVDLPDFDTETAFDSAEAAKSYACRHYGCAANSWKRSNGPGSALTLVPLFSGLLAPQFSTDQRCAAAWLAYSRVVLDDEGFPIPVTEDYCITSYRVVAGMLESLDELWDRSDSELLPDPDLVFDSDYSFVCSVTSASQVVEGSQVLASLLQALTAHPRVSRVIVTDD